MLKRLLKNNGHGRKQEKLILDYTRRNKNLMKMNKGGQTVLRLSAPLLEQKLGINTSMSLPH
jgi:hypothetical protein